MLNSIIRFALQYRMMIVVIALATIVVGSVVATSLPIDVLPDLTRPRVVLLTECPGMAPEEVETLVTFPLETSVNGATGVQAVRSSSDIGLSLIYIEFDWSADIYTARQIIQERIATVADQLPEGIEPRMGPLSSLLGQIMLIGMWSDDGSTDSLQLRTKADWIVSKRLRSIPGVSQVITMGGGRKQFQVLVDPHALHTYEVSLHDVEQALKDGNLNVTGGYLNRGPQELLVRGIGRVQKLEDIQKIVVKKQPERSVLVSDVGRVIEGPQVKRGDSSVNGTPAVVLTIQKQPGKDTRQLTDEIMAALDDMRPSLSKDIVIEPTYTQREFIDYGVTNVVEALRDGALLVVVILFLFLFNFRTTFITLTAIPLSILTTALVFRWYGLSINVMTLGGLAVAMGELVDDAIVDVENIFQRLKLNAQLENPRSAIAVIYDASLEVRGAIIMSTILVILVFAPLFALSGIQGRMFTPLGVAYIVSILASTMVSLTVTPVLSYYLLPRSKVTQEDKDSFVLRMLKKCFAPVIRLSMSSTAFSGIMLIVGTAIVASVIVVMQLGRDFLPPFDEGAAQVNVFLPPGTSLETSRQVSTIVDRKFDELKQTDANPKGPIQFYTAKTGRAELDEHVMGVNVTEYVLKLNPDSGFTREELIVKFHEVLEDVPGIQVEVDQPINHLISHMISGVTAQIAIKLFGDDLDVLRRKADEIKETISSVEGIAAPVVEQQQLIPQLRIELNYDRLSYYGLSAREVNELVETALNGRVVSTVLQGQRQFDMLLRFDEDYRNDVINLRRLPIELPSGGRIPLSSVAKVYQGAGPNTISREETRRRIVVRVNARGRDLASVVGDIQQKVANEVELPSGYFVTYGGQFEAQQAATTRILLLSVVALCGVFLVLYSVIPSTSVVSQILLSLPIAFVGGVIALMVTGQTLSVAGMVGFISLGGIAARNGILLVEHYIHLYPEQGFTKQMIITGSLERLAPVLMTALTTGFGLVPLVIGGHLPGKEILFPVATVILGGLVTSTFCEFLVRPGLFWHFSQKSIEKLAKQEDSDLL